MILFLLFYIIYVIYRSMEAMHMLQQNLYNENNRYLKWLRKNFYRVLSITDFIPILFFTIILFIPEKTVVDITLIASMFVYLYGIYFEYRINKERENKLPLKFTKRIGRLFITILIIYLIPMIILFKVKNYLLMVGLLILLALMSGFIYYVTYFCSVLNTPINMIEYSYYIHKAKKKLSNYPNLKVIGITGSYGKTSSKNILGEILGNKYITRVTPKNYNTPYGLTMTINNYLDKFDEVFVAEMGAYVKGRIKNLCDIVHPQFGILTIIGKAHLETFKTQENIQKTKFELIESLPSDGLGVLNGDDPLQVNYVLKNNVPIMWIGIENTNCDLYASNIKIDGHGMHFDCHYRSQVFPLQTRLLGKHNIYNILSSVAIALHLGISIEEIKSSVLALRPTEHRLELKKVGNFYELDDAYNSNPVGSSSALEVLSMMDGKKVIVTPGMVELGKKEDEENYVFGEKISEVCDAVILVGKNQTKEIAKALKDKKFDEDNLFIVESVKEAFPIVNALKEEKEELYVLVENDLPDIYLEGGKKK